jgi:hypothetical protein
VAVGVFEVHAAAPVSAVDLSRPAPVRVGPVLEASIADASEDLVEVALADQEGVVLGRNLAIDLVEVERDAVVDLDDEERPEARGRRAAEDLGEELCRTLLVAAPDDRMVESHAHGVILGQS